MMHDLLLAPPFPVTQDFRWTGMMLSSRQLREPWPSHHALSPMNSTIRWPRGSHCLAWKPLLVTIFSQPRKLIEFVGPRPPILLGERRGVSGDSPAMSGEFPCMPLSLAFWGG